MTPPWGTKTSRRRKRAILRTRFRSNVLELHDPAQTSAAPSIDDIRRQITSAASQGLSLNTLSRSREKGGRQKPASKASVAPRKRGAVS